jgi:YD repeat-containing protein
LCPGAGELYDAGLGRRRVDEFQRQLGAGRGEQPLAGARYHREDGQVQLVGQAPRSGELTRVALPVMPMFLPGPLLEFGDLGDRAGRRDQGRVLPVRGLERAGDESMAVPFIVSAVSPVCRGQYAANSSYVARPNGRVHRFGPGVLKNVASGTNLTNPDIIGQVKSITDISGRTITFLYDTQGLMAQMTDGDGTSVAKVFKFGYDMTQGNKNVKLVSVTDPRGNTTTLSYYTAPQDPAGHHRRDGHRVLRPRRGEQRHLADHQRDQNRLRLRAEPAGVRVGRRQHRGL